MTAKQAAIEDIRKELQSQGKCFIAFKNELNPVMRKLVSSQLRAQKNAHKPVRAKLVAHCFLAKSEEAVLKIMP